MKLDYTTGCICDSLEVDGKEFNELSFEEKKAICHKLIDNVKDDYVFQELYITFMETECIDDEAQTSGPCECCGDYIYQYHKEIKD